LLLCRRRSGFMRASKERPEPGASPRERPSSREALVRARLANLLASLGGLPAMPWPGLSPDLLGFFDDLPPVLSVLHWKLLPPVPGARYSGVVEHLVIAPRGVVAVGPSVLEEAYGSARASGHSPAASGHSPAASGHSPAASGRLPVREALRRAHALRLWLRSSGWPDVPVLAAVCRQPGPGCAPAPVVIGDLWVGEAGKLPEWLCSGRALGPAARRSLVELLQGGLGDC
jgi:hypothetical protein